MSSLFLILQVAGCQVAVDAHRVRSVIELGIVYPVPRAPIHVAGLAALRSQTLTVIDMRLAIGLDTDIPEGDRAPVVEVDGHAYALRCDGVDEVIEVPRQTLTIPGGFGAAWERFARRMIETPEGPALLLDIDRLVKMPVDAAN